MVLINYESLYQSSIIVSRNSYIINDLIPILIKDTSKNNIFNILFIAHQDQDDSSIFINTTIRVDETERRSIIQNNLYCWKMKMEQYSSIISNIDFSRMYCTDLNMVQSIDHPLYYKNIAIKQIDDKHISVLDLHFTRDIFIKSNIYLKSFININNIENIFTDKKYKNMEYINIEQIKLDGTMKDDEKRLTFTHYTLNCGPAEFKFNFIANNIKDDELKIPMDKSIYIPLYSLDQNVTDYIIKNDYVYLVFVSKTKNLYITEKTYILKIPIELAKEKTNFIDIDFIYKED